jgi:hypothetical protein
MVTSSISRLAGSVLRISFSEVLIGVGCACVHRDECMYIFVSVCVYTVFRKKTPLCAIIFSFFFNKGRTQKGLGCINR